MDSEISDPHRGGRLSGALGERGIDHFFANPGTDFAPIVEPCARAARTIRKVPGRCCPARERGPPHGDRPHVVSGRPQR